MAEVLPIRPRAAPDRPTLPPTPAGLSAASRRLWRSITSEWSLDAAALPLLAAGLECLDRYRAAAGQIRRDGPTITTSSGTLRTHPAHTVLRDNLTQARQIFRQLNLELEPPLR